MDIGEICNRTVVFATEEMMVKELNELMRGHQVPRATASINAPP